ncbi:uncharacterized protein K489DRAFT_188258 [Dissoconium aciculare CBS 342.82]|uniref:Vitamin K epoxide reductase domain-containing protein n=1 Tax=Dissoconium aciculare CBS 342.82 TaxID=1314786 RepID=A0A6J3MA41_9PEZI|nr:uncharacterized protein K489DRAFT_188258 [Dissoconium aciculare CBS 342.82]KAF1824718.1 hypothetical protein K489DRAFT_188258 [Dissoconium aciculare CBS 342.82]
MAIALFGNLGIRAVLIISAAVIIGLSVYVRDIFQPYKEYCDFESVSGCDLINKWTTGSRYGIFVGVWGLLAAFLGIAAGFVSSAIATFVAVGVDVLATIFYLAGAVNFTVLFNQADFAFMWIGFILSIFGAVVIFLVHRSK